MTNPSSGVHDWTLVQEVDALRSVVDKLRQVEAIGVDIEANGLFAYRPRLCTVQLAWKDDGQTKIVVIDALRVDVAELDPLFAAPAPIKVLHDLTFDARMLHDSGVMIRHVRDTSVAARLLGIKATGLAAVLATELGIVLDKRFQRHNWSRRPLEPAHLAYLINDVAHLLDLDRALMQRIDALDIAAEVEAECRYKLDAAVSPPRDQRPIYTRIKGIQRLDPATRTVLMHLVLAREEIAEAVDVPSFKVITNDVLLELARKRPSSISELGRVRGAMSGRAGRYANRWLGAIAAGLSAGDVPPQDRKYFEAPKFDRAAVQRRRSIEVRLGAFRRAEAQRRQVDEQVVLPGHCLHDLAVVLATMEPGDPEIPARIAAIDGIGAKRAEQYASALAGLLESPLTNETDVVSDHLDDDFEEIG